VIVLAFLLFACSFEGATPTPTPQPTSTPTPTPIPFQKYGQTLKDVTYCTPDNLPQKMDVYFPGAGGPWPALVYVHGGAWIRGDKSEAAALAPGMTAQGYLVVSLNYRLYPAAKFPEMIEDVKCAIRSLRAQAGEYNLDPQQIAAIGASAGGHLVALLGTADESAGWDIGEYPDQSSRVQAVVALAPPTDLTQKFPNPDMELMRHVGPGQVNVAQASPITYVSADDPPFLLIHGDRDSVVPLEQSQLMFDRLTQNGVVAQLVVVKNGDHSLTAVNGAATPTLAEIAQIILEFLAAHLKQ
jgi:acetyl esterase/lipase